MTVLLESPDRVLIPFKHKTYKPVQSKDEVFAYQTKCGVLFADKGYCLFSKET